MLNSMLIKHPVPRHNTSPVCGALIPGMSPSSAATHGTVMRK